MKNAAAQSFLDGLNGKEKNEIIEISLALFEEKNRLSNRLEELRRSDHEMMLQFKQMESELAGARKEIEILRAQNRHLTDANKLHTKERFGRGTEKAADILKHSIKGGSREDPLSEDAGAAAGISGSNAPHGTDASRQGDPVSPKAGKELPSPSRAGTKTGGRNKKAGKRKRDLEGLPRCTYYDYDIDELDQRYGKGRWRFAFWEEHLTVETTKPTTYLKVTYTPVVSVGLEHVLCRSLHEPFCPKSLVSESLLARILTDRDHLFLPLYRQEHDEGRFGFPLSRQTMSNWIRYGCQEILRPAYLYLASLLKDCPWQQCDETTYTVIRDGRDAGSTSYIWTHRTGELLDSPAIILYCYEKTRGTEHLRDFYRDISHPIFLTSDAYSAYSCLAGEMEGQIVLCGCFMHARRRFVEALEVLDTKNYSEEEIQALPEAQAIGLIGELYKADEPLKELSAKERYEKRQGIPREKTAAFFRFIESLDLEDPLVSERMRDAVQYSLNHKESLMRFLEDGNVPIDNGATERAIRPITQIRRNSLFSFSITGAGSMTISESLIATARANGADPFYYVKYLLEELPKHRLEKNAGYMTAMTPWSEAYLSYETNQKQEAARRAAPPGNARPKTPHKDKPPKKEIA